MMIIAFVWSLMSENGENRSLTHEYQSRYDLKSTDIDPPGIPGHVSFFLRCRTWTAQRILQAQIFRTAFSVMTSRTFSQSSLTQTRLRISWTDSGIDFATFISVGMESVGMMA